jgi:outer membrane protein TolC
LLVALASCACRGTPTEGERRARADAAEVRARYRPDDARPALPALEPRAPLAVWLAHAMLAHPRVEAAYHGWLAEVERITLARSRPEPRLTFELDVMSVVETLMPGLMLDLPRAGELAAMAGVAEAEAEAGYARFVAAVLRTAYATKVAWFRLHFLDETLRVQREALALLVDVEALAQSQVSAGRGTLQDVLRAEIEREELATRIANLEDSRGALAAEFRAALGHAPDDESVPLPEAFAPADAPPPADELWARASAHNPALAELSADVRRGAALLDLARASRGSAATLGLEADLRASPVLWRPSASLTLPIWRERIEAELAAAQAEKRSAEARLDEEELALASELAMLLYLVRESERNDALYGVTLLPKARQALAAARSGYAAGRSTFFDVLEAERQLFGFELAHIEVGTQRELALASLSLLVAGVAPDGAPLQPEAASSSTPEVRP